MAFSETCYLSTYILRLQLWKVYPLLIRLRFCLFKSFVIAKIRAGVCIHFFKTNKNELVVMKSNAQSPISNGRINRATKTTLLAFIWRLIFIHFCTCRTSDTKQREKSQNVAVCVTARAVGFQVQKCSSLFNKMQNLHSRKHHILNGECLMNSLMK